MKSVHMLLTVIFLFHVISAKQLSYSVNRDLWDAMLFPQFSVLDTTISPSVQAEFPGLQEKDSLALVTCGLKGFDTKLLIPFKTSTIPKLIPRRNRFEDVYLSLQIPKGFGIYLSDITFNKNIDSLKSFYNSITFPRYLSNTQFAQANTDLWYQPDRSVFFRGISLRLGGLYNYSNFKLNHTIVTIDQSNTEITQVQSKQEIKIRSMQSSIKTLLSPSEDHFLRLMYGYRFNDYAAEDSNSNFSLKAAEIKRYSFEENSNEINVGYLYMPKKNINISFFLNTGVSADIKEVKNSVNKYDFYDSVHVFIEGIYGRLIRKKPFDISVGLNSSFTYTFLNPSSSSPSFSNLFSGLHADDASRIFIAQIPISVRWNINSKWNTFCFWEPWFMYYHCTWYTHDEFKNYSKNHELMLNEGSIGIEYAVNDRLHVSFVPSIRSILSLFVFDVRIKI